MLIMLFLCAKAAGKAGRVYDAAACLPVWRRLRSQAALLCWPGSSWPRSLWCCVLQMR